MSKRQWEIREDKDGYLFIVEKTPDGGLSVTDYDYADCFMVCQIHPNLEESSDIWGTPGPKWYARAVASVPRMMELLKLARRESLDEKLITKIDRLFNDIDCGEKVPDDEPVMDSTAEVEALRERLSREDRKYNAACAAIRSAYRPLEILRGRGLTYDGDEAEVKNMGAIAEKALEGMNWAIQYGDIPQGDLE